MDSLHDTTWDVLICGTGIGQSLLALALSRSGKKILHIDRNRYYGGAEAAFSLEEASAWAEDWQNTARPSSPIRPISVSSGSSSDGLAASRSYTLTLSPHIIYPQSALLLKLVTSRLHHQLEFQAVGPWWMCKNVSRANQHEDPGPGKSVCGDANGRSSEYPESVLQKVPGTREDVFADDTLPVREKRSLMKFLRWVLSEPNPESQPLQDTMLSSTLTNSFGVSSRLHSPLVALSLSYNDATSLPTEATIPRLKRHLQSIGAFGPGFGAVMPKYGGLAEIGQVACRASAVGGAVYVLGRDLQTMNLPEESPSDATTPTEGTLSLRLSEDENVRSRFVVGCEDDYPPEMIQEGLFNAADAMRTIHSINIISSPLEDLFPMISENGPRPAGVVVVSDEDEHSPISDQDSVPRTVPTYMLVHSSDSGECPAGQCIIYASTSCVPSDHDTKGHERLTGATSRLLSVAADPSSVSPRPKPVILWSMSYSSNGRPAVATTSAESRPPVIHSTLSDRCLIFPPRSSDLAFNDSIIDSVREMWKRIMSENGDGEGADATDFLTFAEKRDGDEE